jgi:hypothetical protein
MSGRRKYDNEEDLEVEQLAKYARRSKVEDESIQNNNSKTGRQPTRSNGKDFEWGKEELSKITVEEPAEKDIIYKPDFGLSG